MELVHQVIYICFIQRTCLNYLHAGDKLKEHLIGLISRKLDDKVVEIMCSYHARNRTLKLVPEDVQFLQPSGATPTYTLYFPIPILLHDYAQPLAFYFLQNMSTFCLKPKYTSDHMQNYFQVYNLYTAKHGRL